MWIVRFLAAQCGPIWGLDEQFFLTQMKDGPCLAALDGLDEAPWGDAEPDATRANYRDTKTDAATPVGLFPLGATKEGICDLAGNVGNG